MLVVPACPGMKISKVARGKTVMIAGHGAFGVENVAAAQWGPVAGYGWEEPSCSAWKKLKLPSGKLRELWTITIFLWVNQLSLWPFSIAM